jgi:hypothetical protein
MGKLRLLELAPRMFVHPDEEISDRRDGPR